MVLATPHDETVRVEVDDEELFVAPTPETPVSAQTPIPQRPLPPENLTTTVAVVPEGTVAYQISVSVLFVFDTACVADTPPIVIDETSLGLLPAETPTTTTRSDDAVPIACDEKV